MSVSQINTKISEAVSASESGDYSTALTKLQSAKMLLAATPDSVHEQQELTWDRAAIDSMISEMKRRTNAASAGSLRRSGVKYKNIDESESC